MGAHPVLAIPSGSTLLTVPRPWSDRWGLLRAPLVSVSVAGERKGRFCTPVSASKISVPRGSCTLIAKALLPVPTKLRL